MSTDLRKKTLIGGVACSLALALACALPGGTAWATYLPEGSGQFDVSVITDVLPTADPEARLSDVAIHVANEAGQHVEAAQVEIVVVPPNASQSGADAAEGASHAISAKGSTSGDGRVLLPSAAVGATYRVTVAKDGHEGFEGEFSCAGSNGETWEVVLNRILTPLATGSSQASGQGADGADGDGEGLSSGQAGSGSDILPRPVRGFVSLLVQAFPYWLIALAGLVLAAGCLWRSNRIRKKGGDHEA